MKHNKTYENETEEKQRFNNFIENLNFINEHNERFKQGIESYELGMNKNCDLSDKELSTVDGLGHRWD